MAPRYPCLKYQSPRTNRQGMSAYHSHTAIQPATQLKVKVLLKKTFTKSTPGKYHKAPLCEISKP